jgi:hypothetical protein
LSWLSLAMFDVCCCRWLTSDCRLCTCVWSMLIVVTALVSC